MTRQKSIIAKLAFSAVALVVLGMTAGLALVSRQPSVQPIAAPVGSATQLEMSNHIGRCVMGRLHAGYVPQRSGDITLVPRPYNFQMGQWDLRTLGTDDPDTRSTHPNPWSYLAHVPIQLYGPGYIRSGLVSHEPVTIADIAPTYERLLGVSLDGRWAGRPLGDALLDQDFGTNPPRLIVTIVYDGGGWNVLRRWPKAWPFQRTLQRAGALYDQATIGSAPSITGAIHATVGTGVFPADHGLPGNQLRLPDGAIVDAFLQNSDPRYLKAPALGELFDESENNDSVVGMIAYEGWHLGMIGSGGLRPGGDRDFAAIWEAEERHWWINEKHYELPGVLRLEDPEKLDRYLQQMDPQDGSRDGLWFGQPIEELTDPKIEPGTPAFARYTGDAIVKTIRSQHVGLDEVPDLLYINLKPTDFGGHIWNMERPQQARLLREQDDQVKRIVQLLNDTVGSSRYVLLITADHGQQPLPEVSGGWRISNPEFVGDLENRFDQLDNEPSLVAKITTADIYLNGDEAAANLIDPDALARWISTYTVEDNIPPNAPGTDRVPLERLDDPLFAGVFTASFMQSLSSDSVRSLGPGRYREGHLCPAQPPTVFRS